MAIDYLELIKNGKVLCDNCKKGYIEPAHKDIPIEKVTLFICSNCKEQMNITKKLKL